jgi:hypothetical protein
VRNDESVLGTVRTRLDDALKLAASGRRRDAAVQLERAVHSLEVLAEQYRLRGDEPYTGGAPAPSRRSWR